MKSMPLRSSERASVKRRASSATWLAYASRPTRVARIEPLPAATKLPDITGSPGSFSTGSDSPVSRLSSISMELLVSTSPSTTTWSPGSSSSRSSRTTSLIGTSTGVPLRRTRAFGLLSTARRSRVRFARTSWTTPTTVLAMITPPNSASFDGPTTSMITNRLPSSRLK